MEIKILGVEGGGTKTDWVLCQPADQKLEIIQRGQLPAGNFRLSSGDTLNRMFRELPSKVTDVGVFLAGCVTDADRQTLFRLCRDVWPDSKISVGSDRESSLAAAFGNGDGIAVISGTGSAVTGKKDGRMEKAGGRGHLLGDRGGAYFISLEGLRLALRQYDLEHRTIPLAQNILRALALNEMEDLIHWTQNADKFSISRLAPVLFETASQGDLQMQQIIVAGATALAQYTASVARWLHFSNPPVRLSGGLFLHRSDYVDLYKKALSAMLSTESVEVCKTPGSYGAALIAMQRPMVFTTPDASPAFPEEMASTEQSNPRARDLEQKTISELIDLFVEEEQFVADALAHQKENLEKAVEWIAAAFLSGGRLIYIGAGTSGRLGVLDASEIPPTFGVSSDMVQGIIAGGFPALHTSIEGAEDNELQGRLAISQRGVRPADIVCGITASGRTPFVLAGLQEARKIGARTILLTCNPDHTPYGFGLEINLPTGPELVTGSTRLKAGTATKVALNILTTCSMIRCGRVIDNTMVDLKATNSKLRDRAIRIVQKWKGYSYDEAQRLLSQEGWNVRKILNRS